MDETPFTRLKSWRAAHDLVLAVYRLTEGFPDEGPEGLAAGIRRSAITIASKIAAASALDDPWRTLEEARFAARELWIRLRMAEDLKRADAASLKPLFRRLSKVERRLRLEPPPGP